MGISRKKIYKYCMQLKKKVDISIIIIGYNTLKELNELLKSINLIEINKSIEVVYVDDGSKDHSYDFFNSYLIKFSKNSYRIKRNKGRAFATKKGASISSGDWLYFIRSNEVILKNTLSEYFKIINGGGIFAIMGVVKYRCKDTRFENYLNSNYRGISKYASGSKIDYNYLLLNNSIIHQSILKKIHLNKDFDKYGGEELDFSFRLNKNYPGQTIACPKAIVLRNNYPILAEHCKRLIEFGKNNFKLLSFELKLKVIKYQFLLNPKMKPWIDIINKLCIFLYKIDFRFKKINYTIIRLLMLCAILRGYHKGS